MCLGEYLAWSAAAINTGIALWSIQRMRRATRWEQQQFERWMAIEREQEAAWERRKRELNERGF
jgi:hypothetical protein